MPQHSLDCTHQMYYFQQVALLFHLTENEAFQSSCPCGMICMSQVIQNQVSPNDPSAWSFFMHIYMVRMSQSFQKRLSPKIHLHGASSCVLYQYDSNGSATSMWYYHYYFISFGTNMCITAIEIHFRCKTIEGIIQINRVTIILLK